MDASAHISITIGLVVAILSIAPLPVLAFFQLREALQPWDYLSRLRWYLFILLTFVTLTAVPSIVYLFMRYFNYDNETVRALVTILGNIRALGSSLLLVLIFTYKRKEK